jgi:acetyltransferase-like isoleucine patch superfamily enzyme
VSEIQKKIGGLHARLGQRFKSKWNRSLPLYEEILGDKARWARARFLGFEDKASIYESSHVYGDVKVGKGTWIGPFAILDGTGGLEIGDYCSISTGVQIYTHETVDWALTGGKAKARHAPVRIGNCCFIGSSTIVRMGVEIGDQVLVGFHSYVNKSIPSKSIAMGCPARVVGKVQVRGDMVTLQYKKDRQSGRSPLKVWTDWH